jgi:hypothetical protein
LPCLEPELNLEEDLETIECELADHTPRSFYKIYL